MSALGSAHAPDARPPLQNEPERVRIVLADRQGPTRSTLANLLRELPSVERVDEVGTREALASALRHGNVDAVIIDDRLIEDSHHLLAGVGPMRGVPHVIVVGVDDDPAYAARARRLGAIGWVAKDRADEDLPALLAPR